jgi:hypothetical protein
MWFHSASIGVALPMLVGGSRCCRVRSRSWRRKSQRALCFGTVDSLILDLLEWIGPDARPYAETLDAWRTSCPALPVWEEANDRGFVSRRHASGGQALVSVSAAGSEHLREHGRPMRR